MPEQTAIVLQSGKKALVGGLSWQPLVKVGYSQRVTEIRELADRTDATRHVLLQTAAGEHVGLYTFDPDISEEERPRNVHSIAAAFAEKVQTGSAILAWQVTDGLRAGHIAVVVIDDGAPSLDMVSGEPEALSTIEAYLSGSGSGQTYSLYTNQPDLFPSAQTVSASFFAESFTSKTALIGLPTDLIKLSATLFALLLVLGGLFGTNEYLEMKEQERQAAEAQGLLQIPQYLQALEQQRGSIGLRSSDMQALLDTVAEQPAVARGWVLETVSCANGNCTTQWQSRGGYTQELIAFLAGQRATVNYNNANSLSFNFALPTKQSGVARLADLPTKAVVKEAIFLEKQAWDKSGLQTTASNAGAIWPAGFANIPIEQAVFQYPVEIKGSLPLVSDFLQRYPENVFWNSLTLRISPENAASGVTVELKGAFYGY